MSTLRLELQELAVIAVHYLCVCAARALRRPNSLELGGVGIFDSENRQIFSDLSRIATILEHGFNVEAR